MAIRCQGQAGPGVRCSTPLTSAASPACEEGHERPGGDHVQSRRKHQPRSPRESPRGSRHSHQARDEGSRRSRSRSQNLAAATSSQGQRPGTASRDSNQSSAAATGNSDQGQQSVFRGSDREQRSGTAISCIGGHSTWTPPGRSKEGVAGGQPMSRASRPTGPVLHTLDIDCLTGSWGRA